MKFSVIVPFFNEEAYVERCARALLDQDFDKSQYEIIFIDNGSTDKSADIISRFPRVMLIREERRGIYVARNRGLAQAKGQIIALTDADCIVCRDWLKAIDEGMARHNAMIVLGKRLFPPDSSLPLKLFEDYENSKLEYLATFHPEKLVFGNGNNMAIRTELFKRFGAFVEHPDLGDTEIVYRCVSMDPKIRAVYLPDMKITHMEVTSLTIWLKKMNYYGKLGSWGGKRGYYKPARDDEPDRSIGCRTRFLIYDHCARKNNYGILKRSISFILLSLGLLYYKLGLMEGHYFDKST